MPPKLTVPERRAGRTRGKSDPIDALAIARAALREPDLSRPRPDEQVFRDLKLLVDHRDDLVDARRRTQQRLRWHLHALDPTFVVPLRMLGRASHLERVSRWLARQEQEMQVRLARELVSRCRSLNREIAQLDQELEQRTAEIAPALLELPGCAAVTAAKLLAEIGPIDRFKTDAQLARHSGVAPLEASSGRMPTTPARPRRQPPTQRRALPDRDHPSRATTTARAPTSNANAPKAKAAAKRSAASNANSHASSSTHSKRAPP